ncbi:Histone-lysine N-methyltransferase SETMAR [Eumeta japonica]|uniref:Histone-lysine N-methyltransferase SETMAR n=1 Tax=Eumeta variegata TaxID=151549 RepID=A0A4C1UR74_EUMVA|nr:Histone-lysine N-methyltransferase SETMAR [Eumeta japonica]
MNVNADDAGEADAPAPRPRDAPTMPHEQEYNHIVAAARARTPFCLRYRFYTSDAERSGRPKEVITPEIVDKIHEMILDDRRMKVRELAHAVDISTERIHHNTPETKEQSKQWVSRGERGPKKAKQSLSANKVMATVFWDARGVIHIDYLEKGKTITVEYYSKLLDRFDVDLKQKRPHLAKKKVLFHQDNARVHTCLVTMAKIHELRYELLPHPAYSPDLAPCDYYLFPNLKKWLGGKRFESNEEVITETNAYFESLEKTYYLEGIKKLEKR